MHGLVSYDQATCLVFNTTGTGKLDSDSTMGIEVQVLANVLSVYLDGSLVEGYIYGQSTHDKYSYVQMNGLVRESRLR